MPKSRTELWPRKTKGTEVAHVTRDSDNTFKIKTQKVKGQGHRGGGILWRLPAQLVISVKVMLLPLCVCLTHKADDEFR